MSWVKNHLRRLRVPTVPYTSCSDCWRIEGASCCIGRPCLGCPTCKVVTLVADPIAGYSPQEWNRIERHIKRWTLLNYHVGKCFSYSSPLDVFPLGHKPRYVQTSAQTWWHKQAGKHQILGSVHVLCFVLTCATPILSAIAHFSLLTSARLLWNFLDVLCLWWKRRTAWRDPPPDLIWGHLKRGTVHIKMAEVQLDAHVKKWRGDLGAPQKLWFRHQLWDRMDHNRPIPPWMPSVLLLQHCWSSAIGPGEEKQVSTGRETYRNQFQFIDPYTPRAC